MNHRFTRQEIPEGIARIEETCGNCGATSYRYPNGARAYPGGKGFPCKGTKTKAIPVPPPPPSPETIALVNEYEARFQAKQVVKCVVLSDPEARLKDCYIILNVMYSDMVAAGLQTKGRQMAGRLLYSAGYSETVKNLERQ